MDMKLDHASLVLADPSPLTNNRLGIPSNLISCTSPATYIPACPPSRFFASNRKKYAPSKLDDFRGNGCLDAMQASSPTHKYPSKGMDLSAMSPNGLDAAYPSWTLKHPSALASFEQIAMSAKGKKVALFLDYDGTLSPIVDDPDRAFMSETMRAVVSDVAKCFHTAIISGRCREKVYEFVGLGELYYAGSHGLDIMGPPLVSESNDSHQSCVTSPSRKEKDVPFQPAAEYLPIINEVYESLVDCMRVFTGVKVENNKFCVSVHYRCVNEESWDVIGEHVCNILQGYPQLQLCHGRKVLELRPVIKWDKGKALEFLLDSLDCSDVFPIYIGDDRTDEDAFKVLRQKYKGYGILVSAVPKETCAYYSLRDPSEVMDFLRCLTKWQNTGEIKT